MFSHTHPLWTWKKIWINPGVIQHRAKCRQIIFKWALQPVTDKNFEQNNSYKKNAQMNPNKNYIIFNKDKQSMNLKQHSSVFFFGL